MAEALEEALGCRGENVPGSPVGETEREAQEDALGVEVRVQEELGQEFGVGNTVMFAVREKRGEREGGGEREAGAERDGERVEHCEGEAVPQALKLGLPEAPAVALPLEDREGEREGEREALEDLVPSALPETRGESVETREVLGQEERVAARRPSDAVGSGVGV